MSQRLKRCAIYTRRSAVDHDPVLRSSLVQYQKCLRLIERRGWVPIPELFDDDGWSGANGERPALERLLDRVEQRAFDQLVVYRVDRLTRSFSDWVKLGQVLRRFGIGLSVADERVSLVVPRTRAQPTERASPARPASPFPASSRR